MVRRSASMVRVSGWNIQHFAVASARVVDKKWTVQRFKMLMDRIIPNGDEKGWLQIIFQHFSASLTIKEMDAHQMD